MLLSGMAIFLDVCCILSKIVMRVFFLCEFLAFCSKIKRYTISAMSVRHSVSYVTAALELFSFNWRIFVKVNFLLDYRCTESGMYCSSSELSIRLGMVAINLKIDWLLEFAKNLKCQFICYPIDWNICNFCLMRSHIWQNTRWS